MKLAILDDYSGVALTMADWSVLDADISVFDDTITDHAALVARLLPFEVICLMRERTPMSAELINALPNLKLIVTSGPKNASIDLAAAKARGIPVSGTPSRKTPTPELAMLMMMALNRGLVPEVAALHRDGWQNGLGRDLAGLTLGLIGLGNIGSQMAVLGKAFGMDVVAWSQNLSDERCAEIGVTRAASLPELMAQVDVASVHLVLSDRSHGLVGAEAFAAAKDGLVLINTSRGQIVDTDALLAGMRVGKPAMAGLDVYDQEPLAGDHPLRDKELIESGRLLLTPHLGYATQATFKVFYEKSVESVQAWQAGEPIRLLG